jgi:hypothetical protein
MQHMSVKHLLKMMNVSNLSQPSQILVGKDPDLAAADHHQQQTSVCGLAA